MNMQNKLYTMQFLSPPDDQFTVSPQAAIAEPWNHKFHKIQKKCLNTWTREELIPSSLPPPIAINKLRVMSMV